MVIGTREPGTLPHMAALTTGCLAWIPAPKVGEVTLRALDNSSLVKYSGRLQQGLIGRRK